MMYIMMWLGCVQEQSKGVPTEIVEVAEGEGYFTQTELPNVTQFALLADLQIGDLVITEVMHSPTMSQYDSYGEWIEIYNAGTESVDLNGLELSSGNDGGLQFQNSFVLESGAYAVLATSSGANGGVEYDGLYSSASIRHGINDDLSIKANGMVLDAVSWSRDLTAITSGRSFSLDGDDLDATLNDSELRWYSGQTSYGDGDYGTPGEANLPMYFGDELSAGDLVLTEIMHNPTQVADVRGEWFEVKNLSGGVLQLNGLDVASSNDTGFSVTSNSWIGPNRYGLFANRAGETINGGLPDVSVTWSASTLVLGQTDSLSLNSSGSVVDTVSYDRFTWGTYNGVSLNLSPVATDETDNDTARFWCSGATVYGDGDYGTPKAANTDCVNLDYDGDGLTLEDGDCDDENSSAGDPTATEICDGIDNDCDGYTDEDDSDLVYSADDIWYLDQDGDGYGASSIWDVYSCDQPVGYDPYVNEPYSSLGDDCDDTDASLLGTSVDGDCDGTISDNDCDDSDPNSLTTAEDGDCDGVLTAEDCNDNDAAISPNLYDLTVDGIDQNCDGLDGPDLNGDGIADVCGFGSDCDLTFLLGNNQIVDLALITAGTDPDGYYTLTQNYYMMTTEVTQGMFYQVMGYQAYDGISTSDSSGSYGVGEDYPAYGVSLHMAQHYANGMTHLYNLFFSETRTQCYTCTGTGTSVSCSLDMGHYDCDGFIVPSLAQWDFAATQGLTPSAWSANEASDYAWFASQGTYGTKEVAQKTANSAGIFDTYGNVYEWVDDVASGCGLIWQVPIHGTDPTCTSNSDSNWNIMVGGAYYTHLNGLDVAYAATGRKVAREPYLGFRLVMLE